MSIRFLNISQIAVMFDLSRPTVRARLKQAGVVPIDAREHPPLYDMARAGPALFGASKRRKP